MARELAPQLHAEWINSRFMEDSGERLTFACTNLSDGDDDDVEGRGLEQASAAATAVAQLGEEELAADDGPDREQLGSELSTSFTAAQWFANQIKTPRPVKQISKLE